MRRRDWLWLLAINVFANIVATATLSDVTHRPAWIVVTGAWPGFVISTTISSMCALILPPVTRALGPHRYWGRWAVVIPTLVMLAIVGSAIAVTLLTLTGYFAWEAFVPTVKNTARIAIAMTLLFGIYDVITKGLRSELDQKTLALRTKERDEAEARRLASEAQLASLESRVNPHFFFNTLNSIAALAREDAAGAERMTTQLASLMRSSLDMSSTPLIPLDQEIQNVRNYLEIEHVRFEHRLRYDIGVGDDVGGILVPRLALQTLVENSLKYAVSPRRDGGLISVTAHRDSDRVRLEVIDDGPGFDLDTAPDGHGLTLIKARLQLLYGHAAALAVSRRDGQTLVSIDLPANAS